MRKPYVILFCLIFTVTGVTERLASCQGKGRQVINFVDLFHEVDENSQSPNLNGGWYIEFQEIWNISPESSSIRKSEVDYTIHHRDAPMASAGSLQQWFRSELRKFSVVNGSIPLNHISYEFRLLEDSPDFPTRELQKELIALIRPLSSSGKSYDFNLQLLSVIFHEEWSIDPSTFEITKRVEGITPVMWQRRQTTDGEPINDADTGLPVYYKNKLKRIDLRNP